ncbi:class IV adenylate cyclase [Roseimaritima sediminicola]|uniref:class IV adenylate cyclase n=1 Tax=Roseimaritima sediminicola TaxID=2662066 RepID=UPI0013872601|nr:class IV adenylate cyclase [Roseimaritima sediminicola]
MLEIELKFPLDDAERLRQQVLELGGSVAGPRQQHRDTYYAHPCRDFKKTTEALRIRGIDGHYHITYKGPKQASQVKTRQELEWSLGPDDARGEKMTAVLEALGFRPVATVEKFRETLEIHWDGLVLEVTLDEVNGVGWYAEIEAIAADQAAVATAREAVLSLARRLGLTQPEPRSYLNLLLNAENLDAKD